MIKRILFVMCSLSFALTPLMAETFSNLVESAEYWWCSSCGLAYPASQKCCLNKDCPLFRKSRK